MPPKRRTIAQPTPTASEPPKKRPSALAKANSLTADQEAEIREAFDLFSQPDPSPSTTTSKSKSKSISKSVIRTQDVRRCLLALNLPPASAAEAAEIQATLDPDDEGFVSYENFVAVAALKLHARHEDPEEQAEEVEMAFRLFTRGEGEEITLAHLRRVARELREDVPEATLKDMVREAKGGSVGGVGLDEFESVMRRAGVFG